MMTTQPVTRVCEDCNRELQLRDVTESLLLGPVEIWACPSCGDSVEIVSDKCPMCWGYGSIEAYTTGQILQCYKCRGTGKGKNR